jgi:hypothetical protein
MMNTFARPLAIALLLGAVGANSHAAYFSGSSADITDFVNGSEVSTRGVLIDAVNLSNDGGSPTAETTINGVTFKSVAPGQFHEAGEDFANASFVYHGGEGYVADGLWTSGGAFDALADSQLYNLDSWEVGYGDGYGVVNLTPGILYELQVFMLDDRDGINKTFPVEFQPITFTGSADSFVPYDPTPPSLGFISGVTIGGNGVTQANGEILTARFALDPGYNGLFVNSWDGGAFNGMQLRYLGVGGDYDSSGVVDTADYDLWAATYGSTGNLAADGNYDGVINAADYTVWRDFYVASGGASVSVPEPMTLTTGLLAAACGLAMSRRRAVR